MEALKVTNILETYGTGEEISKGNSLQWYIEIKYTNDYKETISGVSRIPAEWNEYMKALKDLQIP